MFCQIATLHSYQCNMIIFKLEFFLQLALYSYCKYSKFCDQAVYNYAQLTCKTPRCLKCSESVLNLGQAASGGRSLLRAMLISYCCFNIPCT